MRYKAADECTNSIVMLVNEKRIDGVTQIQRYTILIRICITFSFFFLFKITITAMIIRLLCTDTEYLTTWVMDIWPPTYIMHHMQTYIYTNGIAFHRNISRMFKIRFILNHVRLS